MNIRFIFKRLLFLKETDNLSVIMILKRWNIRFGPYFYRRKYGTEDIIAVLKEMGIMEGSNILIHSAISKQVRVNTDAHFEQDLRNS